MYSLPQPPRLSVLALYIAPHVNTHSELALSQGRRSSRELINCLIVLSSGPTSPAAI